MIGGIFLSTKVGGFTKNGVVQCVKLVEEVGTLFDISRFNGKLINGKVVYNNGITFEVLTKSGVHLNLDSSNIVTIGTTPQSQTTSPQSTVRSTISSTDEINSMIVNNEYYQETSNLKIWMVTIQGTQFSGGEQLKVTYDGGKSYTYSPGSGTSSQVMFANASNSSAYITMKDRVLPPTVRMCKDGTLKCGELVEEVSINYNVSRFSGSLVNGKVVYDNGITMEVVSSSGVHKDIYEDETVHIRVTPEGQTTSPTSLLRSPISSSGKINSVIVDQDLYTSTGNLKMWSITIVGGHYTTGDRLVVNYSGKTFTYTTSSANSTQIMFVTSNDSSAYISQKDRTLPSTVRVFKDGTIKCAEVQEATLKSKLNEFSGSSTLPPSSGVVTCTNGLKISIGAYSFPGSSGDAYTFVFRDENYRDFLKIIGKGASTTITSALDTSNASIWNQLSDITISEIKLDYLSTTTMPSSLTVTWKSQSYTYSLYPSSTNPYSKLYRPSSSQVVLSVLDRVSFTWTS